MGKRTPNPKQKLINAETMRCLESTAVFRQIYHNSKENKIQNFKSCHQRGKKKEKRKGKSKQLTWDKRHRSDSIWFLATESPINASVFPRTMSK